MYRTALLISTLLIPVSATAGDVRTDSDSLLVVGGFDQDRISVETCRPAPAVTRSAMALIALHREVTGHGAAETGTVRQGGGAAPTANVASLERAAASRAAAR